MTPPVVLTIAGSDSGAGAGAQADLKTISALGAYGTTALSALTAQNTVEVRALHVPPLEFLDAQIDAVLDDFDVRAVKTGMLATAPVVERVAERARRGDFPNLVVDPVMVASSGDRLLDPAAERLYVEGLIPQAVVVTPNLREAAVLVGRDIMTVDDAHAAAEELSALGPTTVIVKGGHLDADGEAIDVVCFNGTVGELHAPRVETNNHHGTGCSFAAAIAAFLAREEPVLQAVAAAKAYVHAGLVGSADWKLGNGHGPIDHFAQQRSS